MLLLLKEHPSVSFPFPPADWQGVERPACKTTVVMARDLDDFIASWALHVLKVGIEAL